MQVTVCVCVLLCVLSEFQRAHLCACSHAAILAQGNRSEDVSAAPPNFRSPVLRGDCGAQYCALSKQQSDLWRLCRSRNSAHVNDGRRACDVTFKRTGYCAEEV